jgi:energy-coupling factor transporter ATP-binding protein EcfA2
MSAVVAEHLTKRYGEMAAVDNVSIDVPSGQLLAILRPNGAGKTTTLEMMEGFIAPTNGTHPGAGRGSPPGRPGVAGQGRACPPVDQPGRRAGRRRPARRVRATASGCSRTCAAPCSTHPASYGHAPSPPARPVTPLRMSVPPPNTTMKPEPRPSLLHGFRTPHIHPSRTWTDARTHDC